MLNGDRQKLLKAVSNTKESALHGKMRLVLIRLGKRLVLKAWEQWGQVARQTIAQRRTMSGVTRRLLKQDLSRAWQQLRFISAKMKEHSHQQIDLMEVNAHVPVDAHQPSEYHTHSGVLAISLSDPNQSVYSSHMCCIVTHWSGVSEV